MRRQLCRLIVATGAIALAGCSQHRQPTQRPADEPTDVKSLPPIQTAPVHLQQDDPEVRHAVIGALHYLAAHQAADGSWSLPDGGNPVATTAYTLLAFLAAGQTPTQGTHAGAVGKAADYLLSQQDAQGYIRNQIQKEWIGSMYDHGVATRALAETYRVCPTSDLHQRVQKAVDLIVNSQNQLGGWRYQPDATDADISVTSTQLLALAAAGRAGLAVPAETINRARAFIVSCARPNGGFTYTQEGAHAGHARTAIALDALESSGQKNTALTRAASAFLTSPEAPSDPEWATYGAYYAAPAQLLAGDDAWNKWWPATRRHLLATAVGQAETTHWASSSRLPPGDLFATAINTTILATPFKHLVRE